MTVLTHSAPSRAHVMQSMPTSASAQVLSVVAVCPGLVDAVSTKPVKHWHEKLPSSSWQLVVEMLQNGSRPPVAEYVNESHSLMLRVVLKKEKRKAGAREAGRGGASTSSSKKGQRLGKSSKFLDRAMVHTIGKKVCGAIEAAVTQMRMRHVLFA